MTVYVDDMYKHSIGKFGRMKMSHLIATTDTELHHMATKIGVARRWFQEDHYDICMSKRKLVIKYGAQEVSMRELSRIVRKNKNE